MTGTPDLQLSALALVEAFQDARISDRDCIIAQADIGELMVGLVLIAQGLMCSLAAAHGEPVETVAGLLRAAFLAQAGS